MRVRSVFKRLAVAGGLVVLVFGLYLYWVTGPGYYSELNTIRAELRKIPQVEITELDGNHDLTLEHIWARVRVVGKGEMLFTGLSDESFRHTEHLNLASVGSYLIRVGGTGYVGVVESRTGKSVRSEFFGGSADIGPAGEFGNMFAFQITNIQTAVAHYDDIYRVIEGWPQKPMTRSFRDAKGTDFYYYTETNGVQPDHAADASQPSSTLTVHTSSAAGSHR